MYENNYKNIKDTGMSELDDFLRLLADFGKDIELFALGGTAMVLKGIKEATKDIDFLTTIEKDNLKKILNEIGLEELSKGSPNIWSFKDIRIDFFYNNGQIMGIPLLNDWKKRSELIKNIGRIKLFILDWEDIIITKIARAENRDYRDIMDIIKNRKIDFESLKNRYYEIAETALITDYDEKFKHLERMRK